MNKILNSTTILILGIILFLLGAYQSGIFDDAKNTGYEVEAKIVDVVVKEEHDSDMMYEYDTYTIYADYTIEGKEYRHVKVGKYTKPKHVGETIKVVVDPEDKGNKMAEGGIFAVVGFIMIGGAVVSKVKKKHN